MTKKEVTEIVILEKQETFLFVFPVSIIVSLVLFLTETEMEITTLIASLVILSNAIYLNNVQLLFNKWIVSLCGLILFCYFVIVNLNTYWLVN